MFAGIEPYTSGFLSVGENNEIYWEASGNPKGKPALYLHGGPGGGISGGYRKHFDPAKFMIVSFEQRGCGRSRPGVGDADFDLSTNTTQHLIADIEKLREHLGVKDWLLYGASWGTTLALAYAIAHPDRVRGIILAAVTTTSAEDVKWLVEDMGRIFPEAWEKFAQASGAQTGERIIDAYYRKLISFDKAVRDQAALDWCAWEDVHISLKPDYQPDPMFKDLKFAVPFATLVVHYWRSAAFLGDSIRKDLGRITHIPAVLIHGRRDISSPMSTPYQLHKAWPGSKFVVIEEEGHGGKIMGSEISKAVALIG